MEKLRLFAVIFLINAFIRVESADEHTNEWRKTLCQRNDPELYKNLNICFKLEAAVVRDACNECALKATAASKGDLIQFLTEACRDNSLFEKFDDCFSVYEADENFAKEASKADQARACYESVVDRFDLNNENGTSTSTLRPFE